MTDGSKPDGLSVSCTVVYTESRSRNKINKQCIMACSCRGGMTGKEIGPDEALKLQPYK